MKIEIRTNCKVCNKKLGYRQRTYCSTKCRNSTHYNKYKKRINKWQREKRQKELIKGGKELVQCLICGKWYVQVGSHIVQTHGITARKYREYFKLEVKKGTVPSWFRKLKGDIALKNGTYKNLKAGKKFWFKKGSKTAGRYERSPITMKKIKVLYKFTKIYEKKKI
uniref:Putative ROS/MUCR transcriptional regulator protein n=1 Tax=viral metagenome TaxID=1070528 RepID=A0A6M3LJ01_9ZZZZ